ncbi:MAG: RNA methyltransferase, partial [Alphaproteobacteria bacterium]|nr:RNA methyltransferase [Alphaproteobacteria bacterium]
HCSLNLSQAVLLIGYEWFKLAGKAKNSAQSTNIPATKAELDFFLKHLETELEKRGYFRFFDKKERMQRNLRNIFTRNNLTTSEIRTLHSVVNDLIREEKHD